MLSSILILMTTLRSVFQVSDRPDLYIIAEAGVNHDGSVPDAHALVDLAADAGADAVKFQTFDPAALVSRDAQAAPYQTAHTGVRTQRRAARALRAAWVGMVGTA